MIAVFETGGKQYKVAVGDRLRVERLKAAGDGEVSFDKVLLLMENGDVRPGTPYLDGAAVKARVVSHGKHRKVIVFKHKPRKGYNRKKGHRQPYTEIEITAIEG